MVTTRQAYDRMLVYVHCLVCETRSWKSHMRETTKRTQGYSLDDAAEFLEYDRKTIEYWLRMGHLSGEWDTRRANWKISPQSLIDFLRQAREPMPTGATFRRNQRRAMAVPATAEMLGD